MSTFQRPFLRVADVLLMFSVAKFKLLAPSGKARHYNWHYFAESETATGSVTASLMLTHFWTAVCVLYYYYYVLTDDISLTSSARHSAIGRTRWYLDSSAPCWGLSNVESCQWHNAAMMQTLSLCTPRAGGIKGFWGLWGSGAFAKLCKGNEPANGHATKHLSLDWPGSNDTNIRLSRWNITFSWLSISHACQKLISVVSLHGKFK